MKIAHLILAHNNHNQLARLIDSLQHEDADFYVHLDLKADILPFQPIALKTNVRFIKKRIKVIWGGYSIVQATLNSFVEIINTNVNYSYVNLLSGQDYPIQSISTIHHYFKQHDEKAFMHTLQIPQEWEEALTRITQYHFTQYQFKGRYQIEMLFNKLLPKRKMPFAMKPVGRSQWFTITIEHVRYILEFVDKNQSYTRFFNLTWAPDELFFQTILYNSSFQKDMVNNNLRYIDWSQAGPSPKILTIEDATAIIQSGKLFARKFNSEKSEELLNFLDNNVLNKK